MTVQTPLEFADETDLKCVSIFAYLAGIIDGEGSIYVFRVHEKGKGPIYHRIEMNITNTNPWIVLYAQYVFGGTIRKKDPNRYKGRFGLRTCYSWQVQSADAERALLQLYPYLFLKQKQARLCLIMRFMKRSCKRLTPELVELRDKIWQQVKDANHTIERYGLPEEFQCQ